MEVAHPVVIVLVVVVPAVALLVVRVRAVCVIDVVAVVVGMDCSTKTINLAHIQSGEAERMLLPSSGNGSRVRNCC